MRKIKLKPKHIIPVLVGVLFGYGWYLYHSKPQELPNNSVQSIRRPNNQFTFDTSELEDPRPALTGADDVLRMALLSDSVTDPDSLDTTKKLANAFHGFHLYSQPKIFIKQFPSDFAQNGSPNLFIKALLPLIVHENNLITEDRRFLIALFGKKQNEWSEDEKLRFDYLVQEYGLTAEKIESTQLTELLNRVDIIPAALAMAMAGVQTTWGKEYLDSPFGQQTWVDDKFTYQKFDTLEQAVHSFMRELNTLAGYMPFRMNRATLRKRSRVSSANLIHTIDDFAPHNPLYTDELAASYRDFKLDILDRAELHE